MLCINAGATVTSCNSQTPNLIDFTKSADIVICATGHAGLLTADMISLDCFVIDVGFSLVDDKIHGDACTQEIHTQGNRITPVPG
jgi:methylenetetrahydrofolate dehydrogenase (NADP+) / methenyltetrahydrofolate cyclohydrolase